jgi:branched-chain amino acid transport system permease protein
MPIGSQAKLDEVVQRGHDLRRRSMVRELVTPQTIAEHRDDPFGQHSDALSRIVNYFGDLPLEGKLIAEHDGSERWYVSRLIGFPPVRVDRIDGPFDSERVAVHAVFLQRLSEVLGLDAAA